MACPARITFSDLTSSNSRNGGLVYDSPDSPERDEKLRGTVADLLWSLDHDVEAEVQSFLTTARG